MLRASLTSINTFASLNPLMNSEFPISTRMVENCQMKTFLGKNFKIIILGALLLVKKMLPAKKPIIYLLKSNMHLF